jgi:hypothetical protein
VARTRWLKRKEPPPEVPEWCPVCIGVDTELRERDTEAQKDYWFCRTCGSGFSCGIGWLW